MNFDPRTQEALGCYVYSLIDPRDHDPVRRNFYIGKGTGNRVFQHLRGDPGQTAMNAKLEVIRKLRSSGTEPDFRIIAHGLSGPEALRLESQLIGVFDGLTNIAGGLHGRDYWLSQQSIQERYGTPISAKELPGSALFVSLNKPPRFPDIADDSVELKRRVLGDWTVGEQRALQVKFIIGCYKKLARCIFEVDPLSRQRFPPSNSGGKSRVRWHSGDRCNQLEERIRDRSIIDANGESLTKLSQSGWKFVSIEPSPN